MPQDEINAHSDAAHRGQQADEFLKHPLWREAVDKLRAEYFDAYVGAAMDDDLGRFRLQQACVVFNKIEEHVKEIAETGRLSRRMLDDLQRNPRLRAIDTP